MALRGRALAEFSWPDELETGEDAFEPDPPTADGGSAAALPTGCVRWRRRDGTPIWIELSTPTTIQFEDAPATLLTGRDVTLRRAHEAALRDVERHRSEFLAMLSHELRNPLAPIRHGLSLLERAPDGSAQALTAREILTRQTGQLERLVDDLLDLTRLQRGKMTLARKPLDLADLARDVAGDHRPAFEAKGVDLEVHVGPTPARVDGDRERIVQALGNLLENALRHTPPGGRVTVDVTVEPGEGRVHVSDSGEGLAAEALPTIFEAFRQGRPTDRSARGGLGLGLAVVRGIAELHGGSVAASSEGPGRGSEFRLSFPGLSSPDEPVAPAKESAPSRALDAPTAARRRVLVIEDNVDAADMLCELLTLGGHDVEVCYDGLSGLARIRTAVPDVVVCDLDLPGLHGLDVARACVDDERLRSVRLLALSGCAGPADRARSAAAGFEVHLAKPVPIDALEALLQTPTTA
jgi:two-component system CheB/CheR fusion protein